MTAPGFKVWYDRQDPMEVATVEELDALLDRVGASREYQEFPVLVSVARPDRRQLLQVLVGRDDLSLLIWYLADEDIAASKGTIRTAEEIRFNYGGTATDAYVDTAIPVGVAREAVREFVATGERPTSVEWKLPDFGMG